MSLLICAATRNELAALAPDIFPDPDLIEEMRPIASKRGHRQLIFQTTGIGVINAAMAMGFALGLNLDNGQLPSIKGILYVGVAGAFDLNKFPLKSICVVKKEIWPEYGLHDGSMVTARAFKYPLWQKEDGEKVYDVMELSDLAAIGCDTHKNKNWLEASSLTVSGVSASFTRRDQLLARYDADLENMEGFAAAYTAARAGLPCVEIRVVSNKVGPRGKNEKDFAGALKTMNQILPDLKLLP